MCLIELDKRNIKSAFKNIAIGDANNFYSSISEQKIGSIDKNIL